MSVCIVKTDLVIFIVFFPLFFSPYGAGMGEGGIKESFSRLYRIFVLVR